MALLQTGYAYVKPNRPKSLAYARISGHRLVQADNIA